MSENQSNANKPSNNNRRHHHNRPKPQGSGQGQAPGQAAAPGAGAGAGAGSNQRRRHGRNHHNRPRNPNNAPQAGQAGQTGQNQPGSNIERIYEKYLNLLDQHLIARRKYHDLFYRADPAQKNKLERNFYNTLKDIRDFEDKLTAESRALFEKRNNGLKADNIYTTNHEINLEGDTPPPQSEWADPHFLQSQKIANYAEDKEESVGTADDYLKYKNLI